MSDSSRPTSRSFLRHPMAKWGVFIIALFAIWFGGWFGIARFVDGKIGSVLARMNEQGIEVNCGSRDMVGFPFRMGVSCDGFGVKDTVHDFTLSTAGLRSAAQIYAPRKNIAELSSPLSFTTQGHTVDASWDLMRLYMEQKGRGFDRLSLNWKNLTTQSLNNAVTSTSGAIYARPTPGAPADLDVAGKTQDMIINGDERTKANLSYDLNFKNGYSQIIEQRNRPVEWLKAGGEIDVRSLFVVLPEGGRLALSGPLTVGANGMLNGRVNVGLEDADTMARFVAEVDPQFAPILLGLAQGLNFVGQEMTFGDRSIKAISVNIEDGWTQVGPFKLGRLPAIF